MTPQRCPYCEQRLHIPRKRWGQMIACPQCLREFVAPEPAGGQEPPEHASGSQIEIRELPLPAALQSQHETRWPPHQERAASGPPAQPMPVAPPPPPIPTAPPSLPAQGTARIAKIAVPQPVPLNSEQLPTLHLTEVSQRGALELPKLKTHPLFMGFLLYGSLLASVAIILIDFEPAAPRGTSQAEARQQIRRFYEARNERPLDPYQKELRLAQQAHSRGDRKTERVHYQNVRAMLRQENRNPYAGLTGSPSKDLELERYLSVLLAGGE